MATGRKPKPTHLHLVDGTLNSTRHKSRRREPAPAPPLFDPPAWLNEEETQTFKEVLGDAPDGLLTKSDMPTFLAFVTTYVRFKKACQDMRDQGHIIVTKSGNIIPNPLLGVRNTLTTQLVKISSELGFSPVARARVTMSGEAEHDPTERLFKRLGVE